MTAVLKNVYFDLLHNTVINTIKDTIELLK